MIRSFSSAFALAGALAVCGCAQAPEANAPADIEKVTALRNGFMTAMNSGDAAAVGNLYVASGVSQHNHDKTVVGRDAIAESQKALFAQFGVKVEITAEETKTLGDIGYDRGSYKMTLTPKAGGEPMLDEGRYVVLLAKEADGSWKVTSDIDNSTMPMPMPPTMAMPSMAGSMAGSMDKK